MATGSLDDRMMFKRTKFHYAVFDEGHMLKNMTSARYKGLTRIQARVVAVLHGTLFDVEVIAGPKKVAKNRHLGTIAHFVGLYLRN